MSNSLTVSLSMKRLFFDRAAVHVRLGKAKAKALGFMGRDVRQAARKLIGGQAKRAKPRPAGKPPKSHVEDFDFRSLRTVLYHLSTSADSVIVGPVGLNQVGGTISTGSVPALHEFGGTAQITERRFRGRWIPQGAIPAGRFDPAAPRRTRRAQYPARPFMGPALKRTLDRYARRGRIPGLSIGPTAAVSIGPVAA